MGAFATAIPLGKAMAILATDFEPKQQLKCGLPACN